MVVHQLDISLEYVTDSRLSRESVRSWTCTDCLFMLTSVRITMITATRTVNGFLTLNFSILYPVDPMLYSLFS